MLSGFIADFSSSPLARWTKDPPWTLTVNAEALLRDLLDDLTGGADYAVNNDIAVHRTAVVETGAVVKGPAIIGANCFVAAGAYIRAGVWLDRGCMIGPGAELKSSFVFAGSKLAHFNFVGDSILGRDVNLEAGSIVANTRNERDAQEIRVVHKRTIIETGVQKFGALIGDRARVGANAVIAPGSLIEPGRIVARLALVDQEAGPG